MQKAYEYAKELYKKNRPLLKLKQKLLLKKYMLILKKYDNQLDLLTLEEKNNIIIDSLIIHIKIDIINSKVRNSFDDVYILDIDNDKFLEAKKLVDDETLRINTILDKIKDPTTKYKSNYSEAEIRKILPYDGIESLIKLNNDLNPKTDTCQNIINFKSKEATISKSQKKKVLNTNGSKIVKFTQK